MIAQVPELFDGGYWYKVPVVDREDQGRHPDLPPGTDWCGWYEEDAALVRVVDPLVLPDNATQTNLTRPYARIGGR